MKFISKVSGQPQVRDEGAEFDPNGLLAETPAIREFMSVSVYDDGQPREKSCLIVVAEGKTVKVCLSDKDNARTLWRQAGSLEDCIIALEESLQSGLVDWRTSKPQQKSKR